MSTAEPETPGGIFPVRRCCFVPPVISKKWVFGSWGFEFLRVWPVVCPRIYPRRRRINRTSDWHLFPICWISHIVHHPFKGSLEHLAVISHHVLDTTIMLALVDRADGSFPLPGTDRQNLPTTILPPLVTVDKGPCNRIRIILRGTGERRP